MPSKQPGDIDLKELDEIATPPRVEWLADTNWDEFEHDAISSARIQKIAEHLRSTGQASA
jgi:hypothetical protein